MKWPFSYKSDLFGRMLLASFFVHSTILGVGGLIPTPVQFSVVEAPMSMELVLVKEELQPIPEPKIEISPQIVQPLPEEAPIKKMEPIKKEEVPQESVILLERGVEITAKPSVFNNPSPIYPQVARQNGWEGLVQLKVLVETDGLPSQILIEKNSGYDILDESAVRAVRQWHFIPAQKGAMKFSSWVTIPIRFRLIDEY